MSKRTRIKSYNYNQCSKTEQPCPAHAFEVEPQDKIIVNDKMAEAGDFLVMNYLGSLYIYKASEFHKFFDPVADCESDLDEDRHAFVGESAKILMEAARQDWKVALAVVREFLFAKPDKGC